MGPTKRGSEVSDDRNVLYYGDNLDVLKRHVGEESVNLVYLDPPFNSNASYNVLFAEHGAKASAQIQAFEDTWEWNDLSAAAYQETVEAGGKVADALRGFRTLLGSSDMLAYLSMMAPRLVELHRVLRPTGTLWLHCDPTASHYLKLLLDAIFGPTMFVNEVVWKRTHAHAGRRRLGAVHDTLLVYARGPDWKWRPQRVAYSEDYVEAFFKFQDPDGRRYRSTILTGSGTRTGSSGKPWRGVDPTRSGRHWAIPGYVRGLMPDPDVKTVQGALDQLDKIGRVLWPAKEGGVPSFKQYLDDMTGADLVDVWADIPPISAQAKERLGYPTQKPVALLKRIIELSTDPGDVVLDPFCGCGTSIDAAQDLDRGWVGIDITHLAIGLIKHRLTGRYTPEIASTYRVVGEPTTVDGAAQLARDDPFQFQAWALGLVGARIAGSDKRGGDKGIDGRLYFHDSPGGETRQVIFSVKAGEHLVPAFVQQLHGVVEANKAEIGVLITFAEPTAGMRSEAANAGSYTSPLGGRFPRLQIRTVGQLLAGEGVDYPHYTGGNVTHRRAVRATPKVEQTAMFGQPSAGGDDE
jgi:DNA modification methylase